jgi:hypothetical protein
MEGNVLELLLKPQNIGPTIIIVSLISISLLIWFRTANNNKVFTSKYFIISIMCILIIAFCAFSISMQMFQGKTVVGIVLGS